MKKMFLILLTIILLFLGIIPICTANELDLSAEVNIEKTNTETPIISPYSKYVSFYPKILVQHMILHKQDTYKKN